MNMKGLLAIAGAASLLMPAVEASATVLDFNDLATAAPFIWVNPISTKGYTISNSCDAGSQCLGVWNTSSIRQADPGNAAVFVNYGTTTLAKADNSLFNFNSIDLADVFNMGDVYSIQFTFFDLSSNTTSQTVLLDQLIGLQTFTFNQDDLLKVSWQTVGNLGFGQFDNIVVDANSASAVPEPAALHLMLSGLGVLGFVLRRRKETV